MHIPIKTDKTFFEIRESELQKVQGFPETKGVRGDDSGGKQKRTTTTKKN